MIKQFFETIWAWELDTWANVLEVVGFVLSVLTFVVGLFLKSEIDKLRTAYLFDKTISKNIKRLQMSASALSVFFNNYDINRRDIKTELGICQAELEDVIIKLGFSQRLKVAKLKSFIASRRKKTFVKRGIGSSVFLSHLMKWPNRLYKTTYDDVWEIYDGLLEIIRHVENIKANNR